VQLGDDAPERVGLLGGPVGWLQDRGPAVDEFLGVGRATDPTNGRYTNAVLTDAGWECVVHAAPGHVNAVRQFIFDPLSAEQVEALGVIGGLIADRIRCETAAADMAQVAGDEVGRRL
jgi:hypothetical protein